MATIFYIKGSIRGFEQWLEMQADRSLIYSTRPNFYAAKIGAQGEFRRLTVAEAKKEWPALTANIDRAVAQLAKRERMALAENILSLVTTTPGLTGAEIAARLFGRKAYHKRVNSTCRRLIRESRIERRGTGGPGHPFTYYHQAR